jgi:hypothetical protein
VPRHIRLLTAFAFATLSAACKPDIPTSPGSEAPLYNPTPPDSLSPAYVKNAAAPLIMRPAGGTCFTEVTVVAPFPGESQPVLNLRIVGTCTLKQLGRTTLVTTQTVDFSTGIILNSTSYTAANGDVLNSTFVGTVRTPPGSDAVFDGTETYVSGTGRFANVSGSSLLEGSARVDGLTGSGQFTSAGTITF